MAKRNPKRTKLKILSPDLPCDIIFSILSKSSVKTLLRFTGVSKSWNDLIRSPDFVAAHHHNQTHNKNKNTIDSHIFYMPDDDEKAWKFCPTLAEISDESSQASIALSPLREVGLYNLVLPFSDYDVAGACEGLICLTKDSEVYIWNPHVGSMKILPPSESSMQPPLTKMKVAFGFGFDEKSCDYKVVKLTFSEGLLVDMEIYSLATDSWKKLDQYKSAHGRRWFKFFSEGCYEGFIYWVGLSITEYIDVKSVFYRFNLEEEIFEEMVIPRFEYSGIGNVRAEDMRSFPHKYFIIGVRESLVLLDRKQDRYGSGIMT